MKITRVRWTAYRIPFRAPYISAAGSATYREGLLIELTADDGRVGLGEAALVPESDAGGALEPRFATRAPALLSSAAEFVRSNPGAGEVESALDCAVDSALSDLLAKRLGIALAHFAGGVAGPDVPVNALVSAAPAAEAAARAREAANAGYGTVKLKVGMASSPEAERERVTAVRQAIGPGVKLRLDPNGAWTVEQAIRSIEALAASDIEYVEQPVAPGDIDSLRRVQAALDVPIAADEDITSPEAARRIVESGAARVLVIKPQRLGGIAVTRGVIEAATRAGLSCVITTSIEAGIGTALCLHLAATLPPGSPACGLATASLLESDLTKTPIPVVRGAMRLPERPGLGVELEEVALARYTTGWRQLP